MISKHSISIILICILCQIFSFGQVPPHPHLLEKLNGDNAKFNSIYALINSSALNTKGVDRGISSNVTLKKGKLSDYTLSGKINGLLILVDFPDKKFTVSPSFYDNLIFNDSFGTLHDYLKTASYGLVDLSTLNLPSVIGVITAPNSYNYYVNSANGIGDYPNNSQKLVEDVIQKANNQIDFSKYDSNSDGYIDALMIVHAGSAAEYTGSNNDFWSHAWETYNDVLVDGVHVFGYSLLPEYLAPGVDVTLGVFAHELGHSLFNLPDLYDRDYSSWGLGDWSIMSSGTWNGTPAGSSPAMPDAWSRIRMGFNQAIEFKQTIINASIPPVVSNNIIYKGTNKSNSREYFLFENRIKNSYDSALPGEGLIIYHVDENISTQNDKENYPGISTPNQHYLVGILPADNRFDLERKANQGDHSDPFPGSLINKSWNENTLPNSNFYNNVKSNISISNISNSASGITADIFITNPISLTIDFLAGWRMVSFPIVPNDAVKQTIINSASSPYYSFDNSYQISNNFEIGKGYWGRIPIDFDMEFSIAQDYELNINLKPGWNLIGGSYFDLPISGIKVNPSDALVSPFYEYDGSYKISSVLKAGKGYWIRTIQNCILTLPKSYNKINDSSENIESLVTGNIEFIDAIGRRGKLLISNSSADFQIPPFPPKEIFDVRWYSNKLMEELFTNYSKEAIIITENYPVEIIPHDLTINITDCINGKFINKNVNDGERFILSNPSINQIKISKISLPSELQLFQNYPNPFNPSTTISYKIPVVEVLSGVSEWMPMAEAQVTLKVYDILGKEVAVLINEKQKPGFYSSAFSTLNSSLSSGTYFYQLTVDGNSITRKMILTK